MSSVDVGNITVDQTDLQEEIVKETTLKRKPRKSRKLACPSKCHVCLSLLILIIMCLVGFNTMMAGIFADNWRREFDVTHEQLARVSMLDGVGIIFGSLACSLLLCIKSCLGFGFGAVLMSAFPCTLNFVYFQLSGLAGGIGKGLIFVYGTRMLSLWPKSSAYVLIQLSFVSYSVGGLLATQLSEYYASIMTVWRNNFTSVEIKNSSMWKKASADDAALPEASQGRIFEVPLLHLVVMATCCCFFCVSFIWSLFGCCKQTKCSRKEANIDTVGEYEDFRGFKSSQLKVGTYDVEDNQRKSFSCDSTQKWFADSRVLDVTVLMFLFTHFTFSLGMESTLLKFLSAFYHALSTGEQQDSIDNISMYSIFCSLTIVGRFLSISFSKSYSSTAIVAICLATNVVASTILSAYYDKSSNLALFCVAVFSAFLSPLLPGGLTWANSYLTYSPKSLGLAFCCAGIGCASFSWISGLILSKSNAIYLMFFITGACCLCCLIYTPLLVKIKKVANGKSISKPIVTYV